jgi:hypothetical protein
MTEFVIAGPIPVIAGCDYRSKARPMRKVWNDSFRSMLTLLDGVPVQLEAAAELPVQRVVSPKVLV